MDKTEKKVIDMGEIVLHWFLFDILFGIAHAIQWGFLDKMDKDSATLEAIITGRVVDTIFSGALYALNVPMFVIGSAILAAVYLGMWKFFLKRDCAEYRKCHWGRKVGFILIAIGNMVIIYIMVYVFWIFRYGYGELSTSYAWAQTGEALFLAFALIFPILHLFGKEKCSA